MAISALEILNEAITMYRFSGTLNQVKDALAQVDRESIEAEVRSHFGYEIWDEMTPIAGMSPEEVRTHFGIPEGGKMYLIYIDGHRRVTQPHDPQEQGYVAMDEATARARAEEVISEWVEAIVDRQVKEQVLEVLLTQ